MKFMVIFNKSRVIVDSYREAFELFSNADAMGCDVCIYDIKHNEVVADNTESEID